MSSRNLLNLALALLLAGLIALVVYEPGKEVAEVPQKLFKQPATVQQIVIEQAGRDAFKLQRSASTGDWQMTAPLKAPANSARIEQLLEVQNATSHARYAATADLLAQFHLRDPALIIRLDNTVLRFGTTDALKGHRYLQLGDTVHLITDRYSHLVRGELTQLLSPRLLPADSNLTSLRLPGIHLQQRDGNWRIDGQPAEISTDRIQQLLDEWRHARALKVSRSTATAAQDFVELRTELDASPLRFGLQRTADEIIFSRDDLGLSYHFSHESGERLLELPAAKTAHD
jgi:hypothetical protein